MCGSMADIQSTTEIRRGKKYRKKKPQGKNIMVCPISQGDHNYNIITTINKRTYSNPIATLALHLSWLLLDSITNISNPRYKLQIAVFDMQHFVSWVNCPSHTISLVQCSSSNTDLVSPCTRQRSSLSVDSPLSSPIIPSHGTWNGMRHDDSGDIMACPIFCTRSCTDWICSSVQATVHVCNPGLHMLECSIRHYLSAASAVWQQCQQLFVPRHRRSTWSSRLLCGCMPWWPETCYLTVFVIRHVRGTVSGVT